MFAATADPGDKKTNLYVKIWGWAFFFRSPRTPKVTIPKPTTTQIDMLCTVSLHPLFVFKFVFGFFEGVLS